MRIFRKELIALITALLAVVFSIGIVYAATSASSAGGGTVTQFTTNWGDCRNITNNNSKALFIPANTDAEWTAFINNAPNKSVSSCCAANSGQSCTSGANSCGQTNSGTYSCGGVCSAGVPANPAGYGNACNSSANSCGQTNSGTIQCNGSCSASTPSNPAGYGNACTSAPNSCGQTNSGTIQCNGSCSVSAPSDASCPLYCWQGPVDQNDSCPGYSGACSPAGASHYTKCFTDTGTYFFTLYCLETPSLSDFDCAGP